MSYKPIFYAPLIAPPPSASGGSPSTDAPFTDADTDYAALTAAHSVTTSVAGHGALKITLSGAAKPTLLSVAGGQVSYLPSGKDYLLAAGKRLRLDSSSVGALHGTLILGVQFWDAAEAEIKGGGLVRALGFVGYQNVDPTVVLSTFGAYVASAPALDVERGSGLDPAVASRGAINTAFLSRFMSGEVSLFVPGGRVIGAAAASPSGSGAAEITFVFFDQSGCPDSAIPFLRALPSIGGSQWQAHPLIVALPTPADDPTALEVSKVGYLDYDGGTTVWDNHSYAVRGSVCYPATSDGNAPFDVSHAPAPIVFIVHGNHATTRDPNDADPEHERSLGYVFIPSPVEPVVAPGSSQEYVYVAARGWVPDGWVEAPSHSGWILPDHVEDPAHPGRTITRGHVEIPNHKGYEYLQTRLAKMGVVAVSVDCNEANGRGLNEIDIYFRTDLLHASIIHFQSLAAPGGTFDSMIDFARVGLLGHSRGGEVVINLPEKNSAVAVLFPLQNVTIKGVLSLAPTNVPSSIHTVADYAFLTLLPAGDGDVVTNSGTVFYDRANANPFRSQLYAHFTNHNYFNREWLKDDGHGPRVLSRGEHERILLAYGSAFFRHVLLGQDTIGFLNGDIAPSGVASCSVYLSFASSVPRSPAPPTQSGGGGPLVATIDDYEAAGSATGRLNTLGRPTSAQGFSEAERLLREIPPALIPASTFFGDTTAMIVSTTLTLDAIYRSELAIPAADLTGLEIWLRAAEVYVASFIDTSPTGFSVGIEDAQGVVAWVDTDDIGGLAPIYDRRDDDLHDLKHHGDFTKTVLQTLRVKASAFIAAEPTIQIDKAAALLLRFNRRDARTFVIDDIQVIDPAGKIP